MFRTLARSLVHQHGNNSATRVRANVVGERPPTIHRDWLRVTVLINHNYCVPQWDFVEMTEGTGTLADNCQTLNLNCFAVNHVPFVARQSQKKGRSPIVKQLKYVKDVSCVDQLSSVPTCHLCPHCCSKSACRGQTEPVLENFGRPRYHLQGHNNQERLHTPLRNRPTLTRSAITKSGCVNPLMNSYLMEALHALIQKNAAEKVNNQTSGFLQQTFLGSKTQPQMQTYSKSEFTECISEIRNLQNGDTREHKDFLAER